MFGGEVYAALVEGFRALFLIVVPVTIAVMVAGALAGVLQTSTAVVDTAIGYAARLLAGVIAIYIFFPAFSRALMALAERVFS